MATRQEGLDKLLARLNIASVRRTDTPLYEVIAALIKQVKELLNALDASISSSSADLSNKTYITSLNESASLPNSRELTAGDNISLDSSVPNKIIINAIPISSDNLTNAQIIELFRYAFRRLDLIEELLGINRSSNDILVPENDLELIQDSREDNIGVKSMR